MSEREGWRGPAGLALGVVGWLFVALGTVAATAYAWGVIDVLDQPDRSWIYWGLAILFVGIFLVRGGLRLIALGATLRRP